LLDHFYLRPIDRAIILRALLEAPRALTEEEELMATKRTTTDKKPEKKPAATARKTTRTRTEAPMIIRDVPLIVRHHRDPTYQEIAERAYDLFQRRGCTHGYDLDDWAQAERELRAGV
jgi:hypothetical protein